MRGKEKNIQILPLRQGSNMCVLHFYVHVCASVYICMRLYRGQEVDTGCPLLLFTLFLRQGLSVEVEPTGFYILADRKLQWSSCLHTPSTGISSIHSQAQILIWVLGIKLRSSCLHDTHFTSWAISSHICNSFSYCRIASYQVVFINKYSLVFHVNCGGI